MSALKVATIIVGYKNANDIIECLAALDRQIFCGQNHIFIVENGGAAAYDQLVDRLDKLPYLRREAPAVISTRRGETSLHVQTTVFTTEKDNNLVHVALARENLGYGAGINSWLLGLQTEGDWDGYWILNPDTAPLPDALDELVAVVAKSGKGMAPSLIVGMDDPAAVHAAGIRWSDLRCAVMLVGSGTRQPIPMAVQIAMDSPSGCSLYVTRDCVARIGPLPEDYFLYYEDIEWGMRAKAAQMLVSCVTSIVPHKHGTTIGSAVRRADRSSLSVYLAMRNRIIFVRRIRPLLLPWAILRSLMAVTEYLLAGSPRNARAAADGFIAALKGEKYRPPFLDAG